MFFRVRMCLNKNYFLGNYAESNKEFVIIRAVCRSICAPTEYALQ